MKKITLVSLIFFKLVSNASVEVVSIKKSETLDSLKEMALSEKYEMPERWKALTSLTYMQKEQAVPVLQKALEAKEWFMRNAGLVGMQYVNEIEAKKSARKLLKDKALIVRSAAVDVLAKDCSSKDRELLWEQLHDKINFRKGQSLWIRSQIVKILSEGPLKEEFSLFLKYVKEDDLQIQNASAAALEKITKRKLSLDEWLHYKAEMNKSYLLD